MGLRENVTVSNENQSGISSVLIEIVRSIRVNLRTPASENRFKGQRIDEFVVREKNIIKIALESIKKLHSKDKS